MHTHTPFLQVIEAHLPRWHAHPIWSHLHSQYFHQLLLVRFTLLGVKSFRSIEGTLSALCGYKVLRSEITKEIAKVLVVWELLMKCSLFGFQTVLSLYLVIICRTTANNVCPWNSDFTQTQSSLRLSSFKCDFPHYSHRLLHTCCHCLFTP